MVALAGALVFASIAAGLALVTESSVIPWALGGALGGGALGMGFAAENDDSGELSRVWIVVAAIAGIALYGAIRLAN